MPSSHYMHSKIDAVNGLRFLRRHYGMTKHIHAVPSYAEPFQGACLGTTRLVTPSGTAVLEGMTTQQNGAGIWNMEWCVRFSVCLVCALTFS